MIDIVIMSVVFAIAAFLMVMFLVENWRGANRRKTKEQYLQIADELEMAEVVNWARHRRSKYSAIHYITASSPPLTMDDSKEWRDNRPGTYLAVSSKGKTTYWLIPKEVEWMFEQQPTSSGAYKVEINRIA